MKRLFYVVNFKETKFDQEVISSVVSGICDVGYENEADAIRKCWELTDAKFNEHLEENDFELAKDPDNNKIYRESADDGRWQCFYYYGDTYECWVSAVSVNVGRTRSRRAKDK